MLTETDQLPAGLLDCPAGELHRMLPGPTLIHLPGRRSEPLFVSVLLHGNEPVGWDAARHLLRGYRPGGGKRELPRALSLFIGNLAAARQGLRRLDKQPDYNRVWPGADAPSSHPDEQHMMRHIVNTMARRNVFASIDIHNNTGINPHYACINRLDHAFLHLASLFSRTLVYFTRPTGVQSLAMAALCPAVTLECGKSGQRLGEAHAAEYLNAALHLVAHPNHPVAAHDVDLFHTVAIVKVPEGTSFAFNDDNGAEIGFAADLERLNFREIPAGTPLARVRCHQPPLRVMNEHDQDVSSEFLQVVDNELLTRKPLMPSMLTTDENAVRLDCLCYFMERFPLP
jgi:succinylglutamate desuccinylase